MTASLRRVCTKGQEGSCARGRCFSNTGTAAPCVLRCPPILECWTQSLYFTSVTCRASSSFASKDVASTWMKSESGVSL